DKCLNCGKMVDLNDIFCSNCGFNLSTTSIVKKAKETIEKHLTDLDVDTITRYQRLEERIEGLKNIPNELEQQRTYLGNLNNSLVNAQAMLGSLTEERKKEYKDVEKLEKLSTTSLLARIKSTKDQQLEKEKVEYLNVLNKEEAAARECQELTSLISHTEKQIYQLEDLLQTKFKLEKELEELIHNVCHGVVDPIEDAVEQRLTNLENQIGPITDNRSRIFRAKNHVEHAIADLDYALEALRSASGFSTWDLLGGGLITDSIKHSKMSDARNRVHNAHNNIQRAIQECPDIRSSLSRAYVEEMSFFWDGFMDNIFSDLAARDKIHRSRESVRQALQDASTAKQQLDNKLSNVNQHFNTLNKQVEEAKKKLLEERRRMINEAIKK
ncbi:MAG: hypothetical protein ACFFDT_38625, partial [Candidatus Hodarchaeota archaeon]